MLKEYAVRKLAKEFPSNVLRLLQSMTAFSAYTFCLLFLTKSGIFSAILLENETVTVHFLHPEILCTQPGVS